MMSGSFRPSNLSNSLTLQRGATTTFLISSADNFTSINLIGSTVTYGGDLVFNITSYTPAAGEAFTLFNMTGGASWNGDFTSVMAGSLIFTDDSGIWSATDGSLNYQFSDSTGQLSVTTAVPEPSVCALFGIGALALVIAYRHRV